MLAGLIRTTEEPTETMLPIADIRRDGGTQPRDGMSEDVVTDYVAALADGVQFPPVDVMFDGTHYWLFDGFHRVETYLRGGRMAISAHIYNGTLEEAQWRSYAANQSHGLRRSTADKGRAIRAALGHANGVSKSDREIAKHLGVDHKTIGKYRAEMQTGGEIPQVTGRTGGDGKTYNIGNRPSRPAPPSAPTPRPLNLDETIAVIWRLLKSFCVGDHRAETLHVIVAKRTKMTDYNHLLTSEVAFSLDVFSRAWTTVANELLGRIEHANRTAQKAQPTQPQAVVETVSEAPPASTDAISELVELVELPVITGASLVDRLTSAIEQARFLLTGSLAADYGALTEDYETADEIDGLLKFMERAIKEAVYKGRARKSLPE